MRENRIAIFTLSLISITAVAVVLVCIQMINVTDILSQNRRIASKDAVLEDAEKELQDSMQELVNGYCADIYSDMVMKYGAETDGILGTGYKAEYGGKCVNTLNKKLGDGNALTDILRGFLPELPDASLVIGDAPVPSFAIEYDESEGEIKQCVIKDVVLGYIRNGSNEGQKILELRLSAPPADFADAGVDINDYCMLGMKGIYITGETSTIVGNVYAGTHDYEEGREEETDYEEKDPYGGINILSTKLNIQGDTILTTGDINIKGSFVVIGSEEESMSVFANSINDIESFPEKTEYSITGKQFLRDGSVVYTNEERYDEIMGLMNETEGRISVINSVYSSSNDSTYSGSVQKILSDDDVTIENDYKGVVITTGNIFVEEGVNIEGLLISGDRIYVKGNNNIISDSDAVNTLLAEEEAQKNSGALPVGESVSDYIKRL